MMERMTHGVPVRGNHLAAETTAPFSVFDFGGASITLVLGDSMRLMRADPAGTADVIVTSPPYNIGKTYGRHMDSMPRASYMRWMQRFGTVSARALKQDGSLFLNLGGTPADPWLPWDVAGMIRKSLSLQNVIHWVKSISVEETGTGGVTVHTAGHFKPIVSGRYLNDCQEYVFHFSKSGANRVDKLAVGVPYKDKSNIRRWKSAGTDLRDRGNVWFIPYETIMSKSQRPHPATFPVRLPEMCILLHGLRSGMLVLDPFAGIGSTAMACARLGVSFRGYDIDVSYLSEAARRLERLLRSSAYGQR